MMVNVISLTLFPMLMAFAAASDLFTMTISNRVAVALVAGFFILAMILGLSPSAVATHVAAGALVLALGFFCFARGWVGGGDAKLAAATAMWLGFEHMFEYLVWASLLGGALTIALMSFRMMPVPSLLERQDWALRLHRVDAGIPYGISLAAAALLVYPETAFMKAVGL